MSGPAKTCPGGQVLTANQRKYFSRIYTFPCSIINFIMFYKVIGFTKQIYRRQVLIAKPCSYCFLFLDFTPFIFLSTILSLFIKMNDSLSKIGPIWALWAHEGPMGPYGPQPGPGPNPDWAPTRARAIVCLFVHLFVCYF